MTVTGQPSPTNGQQDVTPVANILYRCMSKEREEKGIQTYGTKLQTHNGRNPTLDAIEECVDLFKYLVQELMEKYPETTDSLLEYYRLRENRKETDE